MVKRILKILGLVIGIVLVVIIVAGALFMNFSPQFGGVISEKQLEGYAKSSQFQEGKFVNAVPTSLDLGFTDAIGIMYNFIFRPIKDTEPKEPLTVLSIDSLEIVKRPNDVAQLAWFGHSACLLEIDGKKIFLDPMLGKSPAPHPMLGPKRYSENLPIAIEKLPFIDAVIISHDHYDHLDYESIIKLKDKVGHFYVPLGVSAHLLEWGITPEDITELDWWQETSLDSFTIVCTPARHVSGRGLFDNFTTLWSSWIVRTPTANIYFSGDGGYGPHFKEIGEQYGPFDLAMLECGQYNELWKDIHMMPEQTVQAAVDLNTKLAMPIHWGAFTLALHTWRDPITRVTTEAQQRGVSITTPRIGEPVHLLADTFPVNQWWTLY